MKSQEDLEKKLVALEHEFWSALRDKDVDAAVRLTDFPCLLTGARGVSSVDERAFKSMVTTSSFSLDAFQIDDAQVRVINDDLAIIGYRAHEEVSIDGQHLQVDVADSSTWVRRDGEWRCVHHTEAILGDPLGRDRRKEDVTSRH